ncbi:MAG: histone deacetylase, partial [Acidobacteriota bacterium]|nr:histone deacetylase [Acidobacteriota bacterium]
EPPATDELSLAEYRHIARRLEPAELTAEEPPADWSITEEDLMGALQHTSRASRFLGYYSRHGLEVAFERYGVMERLRGLGFRRLRVETDLEDAVGHTLRIVSGDFPAEPLIELRVGRDTASIPGMELLRVEWLQLRNPKGSFSENRPRLPGQKNPGLGLLRHIVGMLVMTCERLGLEGVFFTPSHYHLAVQSRKVLRFLEPVDEARFRAIVRALEDLPLAEATAALEQGRLRDEENGETVRYTPAPMVLPVGRRLKERVGRPAYEDAVARNAVRFRFRRVDAS